MAADDGRPLFRLAEALTEVTGSVHGAAARRRAEIEPVPDGGVLGSVVELRTALIAGGVPIDGALAIYRYHPDAPTAWARLDADGWLVVHDQRIDATERGTALCERMLRVHDEVTTAAWGAPTALLELADSVVADADDIGPASRAWRAAGWDGARTAAGRLFLVLTAMRYLRADAHAAAWQAAGHTAESVAALDQACAERIAIEEDTDVRNGVALRRTPPDVLDELVGGVIELNEAQR